MAYRRNRNLNGPEKCQARSIITSFNGQAPSVVYLLLSSLTVLRSCFPSLQVIGEVIIWSHVQPGLSVIFFWKIRTIFISLFAGLAVLCLQDLGELSLDSFSAKLLWLRFYSTSLRLLLVVSSNTRFNLWKIHFTFSPKWILSGSACK